MWFVPFLSFPVPTLLVNCDTISVQCEVFSFTFLPFPTFLASDTEALPFPH